MEYKIKLNVEKGEVINFKRYLGSIMCMKSETRISNAEKMYIKLRHKI